MAKARHEIHQADRFDFVIVNDDLDRAFEALLLVTDSSRFVARRVWPHLMDRY
jgi:guanylate kinase